KARKSKGTPPSNHVHASALTELLSKKKKKKRVYTEEELGIPKLNTITPAGIVKPKGKKKGKVFVDDRIRLDFGGRVCPLLTHELQESMATILAMVQAEKDGQIESKMMKARQMEEIREARRIEAEKREEERKAKLEETKDSLRKRRKKQPVDPEEPT